MLNHFFWNSFHSGNSILHTQMVMEIVGRRENTCSDDGSRYRYMLGDWEETKEETAARLFVGQSEVSIVIRLRWHSRLLKSHSTGSRTLHAQVRILISKRFLAGITTGGHIGIMYVNFWRWLMLLVSIHN